MNSTPAPSSCGGAVRKSIVISIVTMIAILAAVSIVLAGEFRSRSESALYLPNSLTTMKRLTDLRISLGELRTLEKDMIVSHGNTSEFGKAREAWVAELGRIDGNLASIKTGHLSSWERTAIDEVVTRVRRVEQRVMGAIDRINRMDDDATRYLPLFLLNPQTDVDSVLSVVEHLHSLRRQSVVERARMIDTTTSQITAAVLFSVALALSVIAPLLLVQSQTTAAPIADAHQIASATAQGDTAYLRNHVRPDIQSANSAS